MHPRNDVAERVRLLLAEQDARPGDRLPPERELAARLGVSRSSLREGLRRLTDLGILEARQGSGTYLTPLDLDDLFGARLRLEPYAAALASQRRSDDDLERLEEALAQMREQLAAPAAFAEADLRLHAAITEAARSVSLRVLLSAIADLLRHSRSTTAQADEVRVAAVEDAAALVRAVRDRDAAAAESAMRAHLEHVAAGAPA